MGDVEADRGMEKYCCLTAGHVEAWSDAAQNVLASAHLHLDVLYMGLEDATAAKFYRHAANNLTWP